MSFMDSLRCGTFNVPGMSSKKKQNHLKRLLCDERLDILVMQQTKLSEDETIASAVDSFLSSYQICVIHAVGSSVGCYGFLKKTFPLPNLSIASDTNGRFISCDLSIFQESGEFFVFMRLM